MAKRSRRRRVVTGVVSAAVVVALAGGGVTFWALYRAPHSYRTATAAVGDVTQTVALSGTVAAATSATAAFQTSGTVTSVKVAVGDKVTAGETLATIDDTALEDAVSTAEQAVSSAEQTYQDDVAARSAAAAAAAASATATPTPSTSTLDSAVQSVEKAESALAKALGATTSTQQTPGGQSSGQQGSGQTSGQTSGQAGSSQGSGSSSTASGTSSAAIAKTLTALEKAITALQQQAKATEQTSQKSAQQSSQAQSQTSSAPSLATLTADEAQIAAAQAELALTQSQLSLATLTSPVTGTVAAVSIAKGDSVSAGSSTAVVSILGTDGWVVDATATLTKVTTLKAGQSATVSVGGTRITGKVSEIGFQNTSSDSSTPTYSVVIALGSTKQALLSGAPAQASVTVKSAKDVVTVPTSAVSLGSSGSATVEVLDGGTTTAKRVTVGAKGADLTEISSGLDKGAVVVLADLASAQTSDSTTTTTRFGGAGFTGAGLTGRFTGGAVSGSGFGARG